MVEKFANKDAKKGNFNKRMELYPSELKNWFLARTPRKFLYPERATIAIRQGASEDRKFAAKRTQPKTNFRVHLGIYTRGLMLRVTKRPFLLLELLIGLFLLTICALPLAHLPMRASREAMRSAWRLEMNRLADLGLAQVREDIYTKKFKKSTLIQSLKGKFLLNQTNVTSFFPELKKKEFLQTIHLSSVTKKSQKGEEYYLFTCSIQLTPKERGQFFRKKSRLSQQGLFHYKFILIYNSPISLESKI